LKTAFKEATLRFEEASKAREQKRKADELKKEMAWAHVAAKEDVSSSSSPQRVQSTHFFSGNASQVRRTRQTTTPSPKNSRRCRCCGGALLAMTVVIVDRAQYVGQTELNRALDEVTNHEAELRNLGNIASLLEEKKTFQDQLRAKKTKLGELKVRIIPAVYFRFRLTAYRLRTTRSR
jgi:hypothetical protein